MTDRFRRRDKGLVARGLDQRSLVSSSLLCMRMKSEQIMSKSRSQQSFEARLSYSRLVNVNHCSATGIRLYISFFYASICEFAFFSREHNLFVGL